MYFESRAKQVCPLLGQSFQVPEACYAFACPVSFLGVCFLVSFP